MIVRSLPVTDIAVGVGDDDYDEPYDKIVPRSV